MTELLDYVIHRQQLSSTHADQRNNEQTIQELLNWQDAHKLLHRLDLTGKGWGMEPQLKQWLHDRVSRVPSPSCHVRIESTKQG